MMQGDVNSIVICVHQKARRGIIDEIAGVADFDRRIDQATNELKPLNRELKQLHLFCLRLKKS